MLLSVEVPGHVPEQALSLSDNIKAEAAKLGPPVVAQPRVAEALEIAARELGDRGPATDFTTWSRSIGMTATRVGFILADDLDAARSWSESKDLIEDILVYSVSADYFAVRAHLGLRSDQA